MKSSENSNLIETKPSSYYEKDNYILYIIDDANLGEYVQYF